MSRSAGAAFLLILPCCGPRVSIQATDLQIPATLVLSHSLARYLIHASVAEDAQWLNCAASCVDRLERQRPSDPMLTEVVTPEEIAKVRLCPTPYQTLQCALHICGFSRMSGPCHPGRADCHAQLMHADHGSNICYPVAVGCTSRICFSMCLQFHCNGDVD